MKFDILSLVSILPHLYEIDRLVILCLTKLEISEERILLYLLELIESLSADTRESRVIREVLHIIIDNMRNIQESDGEVEGEGKGEVEVEGDYFME